MSQPTVLDAINAALDGTEALHVDGSEVTQPVSAASLPLPTGAATESTLSSIDAKIPAQGQASMSGSTPVAIASDQAPLKVQGVTSDGGAPENPLPIAGRSGTGSGTYQKDAYSTRGVGVDGFGNDIIALPVYDYAAGATTSASGSITSTQTVTLNGNHNPLVYISVSGTWTGSLDVFCSWPSPGQVVSFRKVGSSTAQTTITANGLYVLEEAVLSTVDVVGNTVTSGTADVFMGGMTETAPNHVWQAGTWTVTANAGTGTFAVSAASLPLPSGASTSALQTTGNTSLSSLDTKTPSLGQAVMASSSPVVIASNQSAVPISASSLPLPTGASTAAKQPALGTAGSASADVITVQGIASMTALKVDGSAVTQPVSGTVTANAGTGSFTVAQATPANLNCTATLAAGTNRIGSVRPVDSADADLTAAKGIQTSRAMGTQDLKDSGRTALSFYAVAVAAGLTTVETAITLTKSSGTSATTTGTSFVVTSGKRFRITNLSVATRGNATATAQTTTFNLRINTAGAVLITSTPIIFSARSATPATANAWDRYILPIPDGYEILGDGTLQFGITAAATYAVNAPTWDVTILGFEY